MQLSTAHGLQAHGSAGVKCTQVIECLHGQRRLLPLQLHQHQLGPAIGAQRLQTGLCGQGVHRFVQLAQAVARHTKSIPRGVHGGLKLHCTVKRLHGRHRVAHVVGHKAQVEPMGRMQGLQMGERRQLLPGAVPPPQPRQQMGAGGQATGWHVQRVEDGLIAIVTDMDEVYPQLPHFGLEDIAAIAQFMLDRK